MKILWVSVGFLLAVSIACGSDESLSSSSSGDVTVTPSTGEADKDSEGSSDAEAPSRISGDPLGSLAPRFNGISKWINSEPLKIADLKGKVVLIDFWTYTCVNCIRTFPYLREWYEKYADKGLVIVGIHTPEFEFEKDTNNVLQAAQQYGLSYPIAQDNDYKTWNAYSNRYWPAKYLLDKNGVISYTHFGEGAYDETEQRIRDLLKDAGADLSAVPINPDKGPVPDERAYTGGLETSLTREIYGGYGRNASFFGAYVSNREYYEGPNMEIFYQDPGDHENNFIYLNGLWINSLESLKHGRETENYDDYIAMKFFATSVNVVLNPDDAEPFKVMIKLDGNSLGEGNKGGDVVIDAGGESFILVDGPRLYHIVELPEFGGHELTISSNSPNFALFAFTFGAYDEGP